MLVFSEGIWIFSQSPKFFTAIAILLRATFEISCPLREIATQEKGFHITSSSSFATNMASSMNPVSGRIGESNTGLSRIDQSLRASDSTRRCVTSRFFARLQSPGQQGVPLLFSDGGHHCCHAIFFRREMSRGYQIYA